MIYCVEADTMLISAYAKIRASDSRIVFVLDSEDTDVYVQTVFIALVPEGDLFIKRKNEFINFRAMLSADVANYYYHSSANNHLE